MAFQVLIRKLFVPLSKSLLLLQKLVYSLFVILYGPFFSFFFFFCDNMLHLLLSGKIFIISGTKVKGIKDDEQSTSKGGKRKKDGTGDQKSKIVKTEGDVSVRKAASQKNANNMEAENQKTSDLERKLEAQSKEIWALKDDLKKHVTTAELREMLEANGQDSTGSELDLRDRW